jgi:hypothetical protein
MTQRCSVLNPRQPIYWITTIMDSPDYTSLLDDVLITCLNEQMDENTIFTNEALDGVVLKETNSNFRLDCMLNPVENLWGVLARAIYKNGRQFSSCN